MIYSVFFYYDKRKRSNMRNRVLTEFVSRLTKD